MKHNYKNFQDELSIIKQFESFNSKEVKIYRTEDLASITKTKRRFQLYFNGLFPYPKNNELAIVIDGITCFIKSADFVAEADNPFLEIPCEQYFDIDYLKKGNIKEQTCFRMFFFDDSDRSSIFHKKIEAPKHDGVIPWNFNTVRITIKGKRYDIVQIKLEEQSYIVIENLDAVEYSRFKEDAFAIQKGIGFLIGYMPGGEDYIFAGDNFEYRRLSRPALKSIYYPVTSNPYSFSIMRNENSVAEKYETKLHSVPSSVVSNLVSQIRDNEELSVAIIFLMEAMSLKSAVSMPGVFSVVLESLANIIVSPEKINAKLIHDKTVAKELIYELKAVLSKFSNKIDEDATIKIERRINALNQPLNPQRITNAHKLREPFDQLGIKLSEQDEEAINYRNYLLHGNILMNDENPRSSKEIDDHMIYVSARLYTLISKLILKNSGYEGYVINHSRFLNREESKEEFFEEI